MNDEGSPDSEVFFHPVSKWRLYSDFENGKVAGGIIEYVRMFTMIALFILVIAIAGGLAHPIGPFIGAIIYVVLRTFAPEILESVGFPGERFNTLIGLGFLAVVFWSPDGVLGLWERFRQRFRTADRLSGSGELARSGEQEPS